MKILFIAAHPDDIEYEVGGCALLLKQAGHEVFMLSACNGCGGHHIMTPKEILERRQKEINKVAEFIGAQYDVFTDVDDCTIISDIETRRKFIRYIRNISPDAIITHRTNDYHADHRNTALLVQDASYMLTVPHDCPDTPAMRKMPIIMHHEDNFTNPPFRADVVIDIDSVIEKKFDIINLHESQAYEWLPYVTNDPREVPPSDDLEGRRKFLKGEEITSDTPDEEVVKMVWGEAPRCAKVAAKLRKKLIEKYGYERGSKVRFAEALEVSEYGSPLTKDVEAVLFPF